MTQRNLDIREKAKEGNIPLWRIAEVLRIHENSFYRMLRYEIPANKKNEILRIIEDLTQEMQVAN